MISQHPDRQASDGLLIQKTSGGSMKKLLFLIFGLLFTHVSMADTINIDWLVDGQTYAQTSCNVGDSITPPTPPTKYGYTFREWRGYTPIEYIESTGIQWIDTGIRPDYQTNAYRWQFKMNLSAPAQYMGSNGNMILVYQNGRYMVGGANTGINYQLNTDLVAELNIAIGGARTATLNGISIEGTSASQINNILLFNCGGVDGFITSGRLYYSKVYKNTILIQDLIPVLDQDGTPCMYDKVSNTCFYNSGTGSFIAGPAI